MKVNVMLEVDLETLNKYLGNVKDVPIEKALDEFLCGFVYERNEYGDHEKENTGVTLVSNCGYISF